MQFLGLLAWLVLVLTFFLAARWPALARMLGGFSRQHRLHHWFGLLTGALVLLHAAMELVKDPDLALYFEDPFLLLGWVAFLLLLAVLGLSFLKRIHHRWWILFHWLSLLAFLAALLHGQAFLQPDPWHQWIFLLGVALALGALLLIGLFRWKSHDWTVIGVESAGDGLFELALRPSRPGASTFRAGSLVYVRFGMHFSHNWHPFSVASCRLSPEIHLLVKNAGLDTSHLADLEAGQVVRVQGPFHEFPDNADQVWIAAGAGIAPFLGMARCFDHHRSSRAHLIFFESRPEPALESELHRLSSLHPEFEWEAHYGSTADLSALQGVGPEDGREILICGSPPFMGKIRKHLLQRGVRSSKIHTEEFTPW